MLEAQEARKIVNDYWRKGEGKSEVDEAEKSVLELIARKAKEGCTSAIFNVRLGASVYLRERMEAKGFEVHVQSTKSLTHHLSEMEFKW